MAIKLNSDDHQTIEKLSELNWGYMDEEIRLIRKIYWVEKSVSKQDHIPCEE